MANFCFTSEINLGIAGVGVSSAEKNTGNEHWRFLSHLELGDGLEEKI